MPVLSTIGTVFFEMTLTVLSVAAFAILVKEYATRRLRPLLFYSLAFLAQACAMATMFGGQVLAANGHDQTSIDTLRVSAAFIATSGIFFTAAFLRRCRKYWWLMVAASVALAANAIYCLAMLKPAVTQVNGATFIAFDITELGAVYAPLFFAMLCAACCRFVQILRARRRGDRPLVTDRLALFAVFFGILFCMLIVISVIFTTPAFLMPSLASYLLFLFAAFVVALTEEHPDVAVRQRPTVLFRKNLVLKAVSLNAVAIWALSIGMLAVIASSFVDNAVNARSVATQRSLHFFVQAIKLRQFEQLGAAENFAGQADVIAAINGRLQSPAGLLAVADLEARKLHGTRVFEIIGTDGVARFSSRAPGAAAPSLADSRALASTLAGHGHALSIEKDSAFNLWVVRAAVPVFSPGGSVIGVVVVSDVDSAFNFSDYVAIAPVVSTGYGFVSESGDQIFSAGAPVTQEIRTELYRHALPSGIGQYEDVENHYFLERSFNSDGAPDGYFYTFIAKKVVDADAFRTISLVAILTLFAVIFITALLLFTMAVVLRPIRELRAAAALVERGEYDHRVKYGSPDELGQLATAFNHMLNTMRDSTEALKVAVRERHDFLEHATKELRTPLSVFGWTLDAMRFGDTGRMNKEQMELVERLHQTRERLTKLVQNLQDVTLIDRGRVALKKAKLSVEDIVDTVAGQLSMVSRKRGVELLWIRPGVPLSKVSADGYYVEKVLHNLVSNAIKYTRPKGFVKIRVEEADGVRMDGKAGRFVKVTVEDNGIGIPTDDSARIFTRFFRATNVTGFEVEGTGLGLYMAKRLVELHGGRIAIESREGVGTTVAFTLPVEDDESPKAGLAIVNA